MLDLRYVVDHLDEVQKALGRRNATETERRRLADLYQTGVLDLTETQRRGRELAERQRRTTRVASSLLT